MVVVGSDVHKRTHTFVAVDEVGRKLAEITVKADHTGHDRAIRWARDRVGSAAQQRWAGGWPRAPGSPTAGAMTGRSGGLGTGSARRCSGGRWRTAGTCP